MSKSGVLTSYEKFISELELEDREGQRIATWNLVSMVRGPVGESLALQAPTGTGKSISALLAAVEGAEEGLRTAIGTATVMLSEQYWEDIQKVSDVFPSVDFFVLKGAAHYICNNKVDSWISRMKRLSSGNAKMQDALREGIAELKAWTEGVSSMSTPPSWAQASAEDCRECRTAPSETGFNCDYAVARAKAQKADVVVTSHAMLMVDLGLKRSVESKRQKAIEAGLDGSDIKESSVLGKIDCYIFDEAHKLSGLVNDAVISHWDIGFLQKKNVLAGTMSWDRAANLVNHFSDLGKSSENGTRYSSMDAWVAAEGCVGSAVGLLKIWPTEAELSTMLRVAGSVPDTDDNKRAVETVKSLKTARGVLEDLAAGDASGFLAFWCNGIGYAMKEMAIRPWFSQVLKNYKVAYISATLGVNRSGQEHYALDTLGVTPDWNFEVDSPFDYSSQMEVAHVDWSRVDGRGNGLVDCVDWLSNRLSGGTVVLTGSHKVKEWISRDMTSRGKVCRAQALGGRGAAKRDVASILEHKDMCLEGMSDQMLVGVDTFSTGMNLPGDGLTKLFIHGIKQLREDAPYVSWRKRWIESEGGDGFLDYELPEKAIVLEQQIGRLIRTQSDWGVVLLGYRMNNSQEKAIVELALSAFDGHNTVELVDVGKRWWKRG